MDNIPLKVFFLILVLLVSGMKPETATSQQVPSRINAHVNDFAGMMTNTQRNALEDKFRNYRDSTSTVIVVATVPSLNGQPIEPFAVNLANQWRIWDDRQYNGVLILAAAEERQVRIEVSRGLEGAVPDVMAGRIIREMITPSFRSGDYYRGFNRASDAIILLASGEFDGQFGHEEIQQKAFGIFLFLVLIMLVIYLIGKGREVRRSGHTIRRGGVIFTGSIGSYSGRSSRGGFSGGGFGGFSGGGTGFGGGGATGGW